MLFSMLNSTTTSDHERSVLIALISRELCPTAAYMFEQNPTLESLVRALYADNAIITVQQRAALSKLILCELDGECPVGVAMLKNSVLWLSKPRPATGLKLAYTLMRDRSVWPSVRRRTALHVIELLADRPDLMSSAIVARIHLYAVRINLGNVKL